MGTPEPTFRESQVVLHQMKQQLRASANLLEDHLRETEGLLNDQLPSFMFSANMYGAGVIPVQDELFLPILLHIIKATEQLIQERLAESMTTFGQLDC